MGKATFDYSFQMGDNNTRIDPDGNNSYANKGALYKGTNHMGRLIAFEPQRLYNFELQIVGLDSLYTADRPGTQAKTSEGITFGSAAERILVSCSSFSVPNTEVGTIEIPHYNNTTKYAGKVSFGNATLKVEQFLGSFTEQIMTTWARCVYDPRTQNIGFKNDYAKDVYVIQYDSKGGNPRVWKMENAWPNVLPGADWDYNTSERRQISYTIVCDRCVPDYGIDSRTFGSVKDNALNSVTSSLINGTSGSAGTSGWSENALFKTDQTMWTWDTEKKAYINANGNQVFSAGSTTDQSE